MRSSVLPWIILSMALIGSGCHRDEPTPVPGEFSYRVEPEIMEVRRIGVMPAFLAPDVGRSAGAIDTSIGRSWRELAMFEVISLENTPGREYFQGDPLAKADVPAESLRRLRADHMIDAVLLIRVEHFQGYDPVALGITGHLVSCHDGQTLWSATGEWDSTLDAVQDDVRDWWSERMGAGHDRLGGWRLALTTPTYFARYVNDRLAESVRAATPPHP